MYFACFTSTTSSCWVITGLSTKVSPRPRFVSTVVFLDISCRVQFTGICTLKDQVVQRYTVNIFWQSYLLNLQEPCSGVSGLRVQSPATARDKSPTKNWNTGESQSRLDRLASKSPFSRAYLALLLKKGMERKIWCPPKLQGLFISVGTIPHSVPLQSLTSEQDMIVRPFGPTFFVNSSPIYGVTNELFMPLVQVQLKQSVSSRSWFIISYTVLLRLAFMASRTLPLMPPLPAKFRMLVQKICLSMSCIWGLENYIKNCTDFSSRALYDCKSQAIVPSNTISLLTYQKLSTTTLPPARPERVGPEPLILYSISKSTQRVPPDMLKADSTVSDGTALWPYSRYYSRGLSLVMLQMTPVELNQPDCGWSLASIASMAWASSSPAAIESRVLNSALWASLWQFCPAPIPSSAKIILLYQIAQRIISIFAFRLQGIFIIVSEFSRSYFWKRLAANNAVILIQQHYLQLCGSPYLIIRAKLDCLSQYFNYFMIMILFFNN